MRHVILGNGPAGVVAAETIRQHAPADEIVLVGAEPGPPYSRMAIPYVLSGKIGEEGTFLRKEPGHFERLRITLRSGTATRVDAKARTVSFADRSHLPFDRLLIATGSVPLHPAIPGIDLPGVESCWTLSDSRVIALAARPGANVVQMGAGFIGCIIMEALVARGAKLTVVEMGDRMVPRMLGPKAGTLVRRWVESKGVTVRTSAKVQSISQQRAGLEVRLESGELLPADLVVSAIGVRPNVDFLRDSGIAVNRGVLADGACHTNVEGVYAAGDCAETLDVLTGQRVVSAIQPNAADQAVCAALNMVGREVKLKSVPLINVLDTLGLVTASFGRWEGVPGGERAERHDPEQYRYLHLEFEGDVLVGANAVGLTQHVGVLRGLLEQRVHLGAWKDRLLQDPLRLPEAFLAATQGHGGWKGRPAA